MGSWLYCKGECSTGKIWEEMVSTELSMIAININIRLAPLSFTPGGQLRVPSLWEDGGECPPCQSGICTTVPTLRIISSDIIGALISHVQNQQ